MKKTFILLIFLGILYVTPSCLEKLCANKKYLDFNTISIHVNSTEILQGDSLAFEIRMTDGYFLGWHSPPFSLINNAYAIVYCDEGWGGLKYPLTNIEITSDSDFNDDYPANTLLNELVRIDEWVIASREFKNRKLNEASISNNLENKMYISQKPERSKEHVFKVRLFKSDGSVIEAVTDQVVWK